MRLAIVVLLPILALLAVPGTAMAEARYPYCPPRVGDRTLTSTSERGDDAAPQIVCWYEDKQPVYEFHASWMTEAYKGDPMIGCGQPNDDPKKKLISPSHQAYVATNWDYATMPEFEGVIKDFLHQLETDFAKSCTEPVKAAPAIQMNVGDRRIVPAAKSREYCAKRKCVAEDNARLKVCNKDSEPHRLFSKSRANKFGPVRVKSGKCYVRRLHLPSGREEFDFVLGDRTLGKLFLIELGL